MGAGAFLEPLLVVFLLFGGSWINRNHNYKLFPESHERCSDRPAPYTKREDSLDSLESGLNEYNLIVANRSHSPLSSQKSNESEPAWRTREIWILGLKVNAKSPNTCVFKDYFLSRVLCKFPFLVEAWYWALIYWVRDSQQCSAGDC